MLLDRIRAMEINRRIMTEEEIDRFFEIELRDYTLEEKYFYAIMLGDYDRTLDYLNGGVPVDLPNFNHGATALIFVREYLARLLLERGANPNAQDWEGASPLRAAIGARNSSLVKLLLAYGADPTLSSPRGTPLELAHEVGNAEILAILQEAADHA